MLSRTSRILLVLALLAAGAYLLIERPRERAQDRKQTANDQLASFDAASIDSIAIERPQDTLVFARADSLWRMVAPVSDAAEPGAIGTLLHALSTADINRDLGAESDLTPYGLDHPDAVITLGAAHRVVLHVAVGKNTVDNAWCYARSPAGNVILVPTDVHQSSTLPVDEYRNRKVLDFQVRDVTAYSVESTDRSMSWTRRGARWFALTGRDSVAGDSVAVLSPLHRLRGLRATHLSQTHDALALHVHPPDVKNDSLHTMVVWLGAQHRVALTFLHSQTGWAADDGARFMTLNDDVSDLFAHTTTELRDRRLLQFDPSAAQRITFYSQTATGEIVRSGGHWSFPNPALGHVDRDHAADFVRALRNLKWSEPGDEAARTTGRVHFRIEISGMDGKLIDKLDAGPYDAETCWVASPSSRGTWLIPRAALNDVAERFAQLKQR